ncbi:MAG: lysine--tRNA ligase [Opitutales bacterium]|nr:lysine--tRNA ligase [Opitutales bacterium]
MSANSKPAGNKPEDNSHDLFAVRQEKLENLQKDGLDPFYANCEQSHTSKQAVASYIDNEEAEQPYVKVAGRIVIFRVMGKASFIKLLDRDGRIQCYVTRDDVGVEDYQRFKKYDLGDFLGVEGPLFVTKTGEVTVRAKKITLVSKSLRPLPEKFHGLADEDQIYRQRYLDLIVNDKSRDTLQFRSHMIREIRQHMWEREFVEVETPVFQNISGGAAARPFLTQSNALGCDFSMRIALELPLKRLLVGGFDRVFEIGKVFRNEGLSRRHSPEFTMMEVYQSYSDYKGMMELFKSMIDRICENLLGTWEIQRPEGDSIDLKGDWRVARYKDLILETTQNSDWFSLSKADKLAATEKLGIEVNPELEDYEVTNNVFEKLIEPTLIQPTFVTHLPKELIPLAKLSSDDPDTVEVFELCINGQEIAPAYTEQNNPLAQREAFEKQAGEEIQNIDHDFLLALEHGMPPAGGMGIGIDRLVMMMRGTNNLRDTILFPTLKPTKAELRAQQGD